MSKTLNGATLLIKQQNKTGSRANGTLGNAKSTIELNGKKYDTRTGRVISDATSPGPAKAPTHSAATPASNGTLIDGFTKRRPDKSHSAAKAQKAARHPEKSKTLMRPAVQKPVIRNDITTKKNFHHDSGAKARELRATHTNKSPLIKRFNPDAVSSSVPRHNLELPVAKQTAAHGRHTSVHNVKPAKPVQPAHPFEHALKGATAHLETFDHKAHKKSLKKSKSTRRKVTSIAMASVAGFLLLGFFAYQNAPAVEMRVAAARSGVPAGLPGYKPSGYGVKDVKSEDGAVSVSFKSRTDNKGFTLTQKASSWNSASLLANTVTQTNQPYQTYQDEGKTVYIYNNSNATWVDGGVWYQVEGDASLTSDQLLRIANSL